MAAGIASILEKGSKQDVLPTIQHPPVNFFISVSGFRLRFDKYNSLYPIKTPSMHVIGTLVTPSLLCGKLILGRTRSWWNRG
jgi:Serine hydrolase (FSH1)